MISYADVVITNVAIYAPAIDGAPWDAIAIRDGTIVALGEGESKALIGPRTQVIPGRGGSLLPGFQDSHIHAPFAGRHRLRITLDGAESPQACLDRVAEYAAANPHEPWILGGGWALRLFDHNGPLREDLDAVVPDRPAFLFDRDLHSAWLNTKALEVGGITRDTPDPIDGTIRRDASGTPSGTLVEGAAYAFNDHVIPTPTKTEWEASILNAQEYLHQLGITGWQDAWVTPGTLDAYHSLAERHQLTARVVGALWWDRHQELDQIPELLAQRERANSGNFHPTTVKIMTDGMIENRTGALLEPYCDGCNGHSDDHGSSYVERDLLTAAVTELDKAGFQLHMHAIGDRAARDALDAIEAATRSNGPNDNRHHIAHVQLVNTADIPRFGQLGVIANCQPYWAQSSAMMEEQTIPRIGRERMANLYPFASLQRHGATLALGSDWSVTTANPLEEIEVAITRRDPSNRSDPAFLPDERLSLNDAIAGFTTGSAYVNHDEHGGTIAVGKRADLVLLDTDLASPALEGPADASVSYTIANGEVVYRASHTG